MLQVWPHFTRFVCGLIFLHFWPDTRRFEKRVPKNPTAPFWEKPRKNVCKLVEVHCKFFRVGVSHTHTHIYMFYVDPVHSDRIQFDLLLCFFFTWVFHFNIKQPPEICVIRVDLFSSRPGDVINPYLYICIYLCKLSWLSAEVTPNDELVKASPQKKIPSIRFGWCHPQRFKPTPWKIQV